jgi:hypothetical protein
MGRIDVFGGIMIVSSARNGWVPGLIALALGLGGWSCSLETPTDATTLFERKVAANVFDITPVRGELRPLRLRRIGFEYRCSECHNDFESPRRQDELRGEHSDIVFNHGMNLYCLNCHHSTNRDVYVDHDGSEIPPDEPVRLCAKCHGPTYREWELGIHGRQNGYWDTSKGERAKLRCIQCHDPHQPVFQPMKPEPAPARSRFAAHRTNERGRS